MVSATEPRTKGHAAAQPAYRRAPHPKPCRAGLPERGPVVRRCQEHEPRVRKNLPTQQPLAQEFACVKCAHRERRPHPGPEAADPGRCERCNP